MANAAAHQPLISDARLRQLYVTLLKCRALRQSTRTRTRPASLVAAAAVITGTVSHLEQQDALMVPPGDLLGALARGHSLRKVLSGTQLPGMLPNVSRLGARFAIATGYALAQQREKPVTLVFSGPGVSSLDDVRDSLAFAAKHKLGILFVVETAAELDVSGPRHTDALGLPGIPVDGDDVIAVYRVTQEAMTRARRGGGPTLIDCKPWPLGAKVDAVRKLEEALERRGISTSALKNKAADRSSRPARQK